MVGRVIPVEGVILNAYEVAPAPPVQLAVKDVGAATVSVSTG